MMIEPAPKVEPATARPARPASAPRDIDPAMPSGGVTIDDVCVAPRVEPAYADPPTERGSISQHASVAGGESSIDDGGGADGTSSSSSGPEGLCTSKKFGMLYESYAAVVIGPAEKNAMQRLIPRKLRKFDDRSVLSYGECKRYVVVTGSGDIYVYSDVTDRYPLYVVPLAGLYPRREDPRNPHYRSHSISPMIQRGGGWNDGMRHDREDEEQNVVGYRSPCGKRWRRWWEDDEHEGERRRGR